VVKEIKKKLKNICAHQKKYKIFVFFKKRKEKKDLFFPRKHRDKIKFVLLGKEVLKIKLI
jgi:hypothetical protein